VYERVVGIMLTANSYKSIRFLWRLLARLAPAMVF